MGERKNISDAIRFKVLKRDKFTCHYCHRSGIELEIDHIVPVSKGGTNDIGNLVAACKECNRGKSDTSVLPELYVIARETKSRRVQLLIRPSIYERIKEMAKEKGKSINDYINDLFESHVNNWD